MPAPDTDRNLLFGVLALQADLLDAKQFVEACTLWANEKDRPLADLLVERRWLKPEEKALVDLLLQKKLEKHMGDAQASLVAVATEDIKRALAAVNDPAVQHTLVTLPPRSGPAAAATSPGPPAGRDRYTLLQLHAQGGIGRVWLARDEDLGREVALKELRPEQAGDPALVARFVEEAKVTGQLQHPAIVPVHELARRPADGQYFYAMRFVKGRTLHDAIRDYHAKRQAGKAGPLDLRELLTAFVAVCNAVAYANSRGVLHRDLKPQNVALGDFGEVLVLDWGLARVLGQEGGAASLAPVTVPREGARAETQQGQVVGTPSYMAPEQVEGKRERLGRHTDVYGLGAVLYESLTGEPPFTAPDTLNILLKVVSEPPVRPRQRVATTPPALEAVCLRALAKEPEARYRSAKELAQEVERWLADEPVAAYPEPWRERARRWVGRHRLLLTATVAGLLVATLSLAVATILLRAANARALEAQAQAETNLRLARQAHRYFTQVSESPQLRAPGMQELRRALLAQARDFYEQLLQQQSDDPDVQAERGQAYHRLAEMIAGTGSMAEAIRLARQAQAAFEQLARDHPDRGAYADALTSVLFSLAWMYRESRQPVAAQAAYEAILARLDLSARSHPDDPARLNRLAWTLGNLGVLYEQTGQRARAQATYAKALALFEQLAGAHPSVADYSDGLGRVLYLMGELHLQAQELDQAGAHLEKALAVFRRLASQDRKEPDFQEGLTRTLGDLLLLGSLYLHADQVPRGAAVLEMALTHGERLARDYPGRPDYQDLLARLRALQACSLSRQGEHGRATVAAEAAAAGTLPGASVLYDAACAYALGSAVVRRDGKVGEGDRRRLEQQYASRAVELLRQAIAQGYKNVAHLKKDTDLDTLRGRDDFKELLAQLEKAKAREPK
jgi:serine/threonine-protein kinase